MSPISLPDPPFAVETEVTIRERMMTAVDPAFNLDPGDFVYDMLTPAAIEIDRLYDAMQIFMGEAFIATASGAYLDALGEQLGALARLTGEADETYRARLLARLGAPVGAGNAADYSVWAYETGLVGFVTVLPVWAGAGTVKVLVATTGRSAVSGGDLTTIATYIGTKAPIGATVTVASIASTTVTIVSALFFEPGFILDDAMELAILESLLDYVDTLGPADDVLYNEIIRHLLEVEGVYDISSLTINGVADDLAIDTAHISVLPADGTTVTLS